MPEAGFGGWLVGMREKRGWTQEDLAGRIEATSVTVSNWERGQTAPTLLKHILLLGKAFAVDPGEILQRMSGEAVEQEGKSPGHVEGVLETVEAIRETLDALQRAATGEGPVSPDVIAADRRALDEKRRQAKRATKKGSKPDRRAG